MGLILISALGEEALGTHRGRLVAAATGVKPSYPNRRDRK
jgi:hypothetical protein